MATAPLDIEKLASLSDEELLKLNSPEVSVETPASEEKKPEEQPEKKEDEQPAEAVPEQPAAEEKPAEESKPEEKKPDEPAPKTDETPVAPKLEDPAKKDGPDAFKDPKAGQSAGQKPAEGQAAQPAGDKKPEEKKQPETPAVQPQQPSVADYKGFHDRVMAPFKANGKEIKLQSADEVVQLMQMGANYTKKMQELQHLRKIGMMLSNNGLLDEAKLSFLIDLDKKNPEAIKKLLVDAKIDPVELDTSKTNYRNTGAHTVTDQEVAIDSAIEDLNGLEGGKELLQSVQQEWDQASKKVLWENPEILKVLHHARITGVYAKITAEIERQKTLGQIPPNTPFLAAYKKVGDELQSRGAFGSVTQPAAPTGGQKPVSGNPVATRPAPVKTPPTKADDPRVKAAAPTRTSPRTVPASVNYLAMSDEDFLKLPQNKI